jgi:hypothetical protein
MFFLSIKICEERHTTNLNIQTSVLMYTITLINTICYTHSSHCIILTLQTVFNNNTMVVPIHKTHTYILTGVLDKGGKYFLGLMQGV